MGVLLCEIGTLNPRAEDSLVSDLFLATLFLSYATLLGLKNTTVFLSHELKTVAQTVAKKTSKK